MKKSLAVLLLVALIAPSAFVGAAETGYGGGRKDGSRRAIPVIFMRDEAATSTGFYFGNNLGFGTTSTDVVNLQERLRALGFFNFPTSTGYFGPITLDAVHSYQAAYGILSTGFVGILTRALLNR